MAVAVDGNGTVELRVDAGSVEVRRELGVAAWSVLELLALGGTVDDAGRWMTYSNARDLARSLGIGKDRAAAALADLRRAGLIAADVERDQRSARFARSRYEVRVPVSHDTDTALPAIDRRTGSALPRRDSFATRHTRPPTPPTCSTSPHDHDDPTPTRLDNCARPRSTDPRLPHLSPHLTSNHDPNFVAHRRIVDARRRVPVPAAPDTAIPGPVRPTRLCNLPQRSHLHLRAPTPNPTSLLVNAPTISRPQHAPVCQAEPRPRQPLLRRSSLRKFPARTCI